ncbi:hypothetical protein HG533_04485 [Moraxella osloensis]|nr:hypothetical protein [Moraxella osloensis]MBW4018067.1 hypothetical protein [Moraxella osloensis]
MPPPTGYQAYRYQSSAVPLTQSQSVARSFVDMDVVLKGNRHVPYYKNPCYHPV